MSTFEDLNIQFKIDSDDLTTERLLRTWFEMSNLYPYIRQRPEKMPFYVEPTTAQPTALSGRAISFTGVPTT